MTDLLNSSNISSNFTEDMIDLSSLADLSNMTDPSNGTMEYFCFGHVTKKEAYYIFLVREFTCSMYRLWSKCLHGRVHSQSHMKYIVVPFSPTPLVLFIRPLPSSPLPPLSSSLLPSPLSSPLLPSSPLSFPLLPSQHPQSITVVLLCPWTFFNLTTSKYLQIVSAILRNIGEMTIFLLSSFCKLHAYIVNAEWQIEAIL